MHYVCATNLKRHLLKETHDMYLNRRILRSNYRRLIGRITDWFEEPVNVSLPVHRDFA